LRTAVLVAVAELLVSALLARTVPVALAVVLVFRVDDVVAVDRLRVDVVLRGLLLEGAFTIVSSLLCSVQP
jgi:hypothetical protein